MKRNRTSLYLIIAVILIVAFITSAYILTFMRPSIDMSELAGNYIGAYDVFPKITAEYKEGIYQEGKHFLNLASDGNYTYIYIDINGHEIKNSNKWILEFSNGEPVVALSKFKFGSLYFNSIKPGFVSLPVERGIKYIRLVVDYDLSYYLILMD